MRLGRQRQVLPWLTPLTSSIDDWEVRVEREARQEPLTDLFISRAEGRVSVLLEGATSTGKTSLMNQLCLDWARGASYLQHFNLVILIDCNDFHEESDLDKHIMKTFKMFKVEKLNLHKWEVQKESFLLVLDNFSKLRYELCNCSDNHLPPQWVRAGDDDEDHIRRDVHTVLRHSLGQVGTLSPEEAF